MLVDKVVSGSPAEIAGVKSGDRLALAGKQKLFGQADFRGVLHRAPTEDAEIPIVWLRESVPFRGELKLSGNWKDTENRWRKTLYDGVYGPYLGFFPLKGPNQGNGSLSIKPFMGPSNKRKDNPWWPTGLRPHHEIVEINGRNDDWDSRLLLGWFRLNHNAGYKVTVKTRSNGEYTLVVKEKAN